MSTVIGELLPLALGVAISPVPVIAVILMLLAPRAGGTSAGFLFGWVAGIVVAVTVFVVLAHTTGMGTTENPSTTASWVRLLLGLVLLALGVRQWRRRPHGGEPAPLPGWMSAIDRLSPARAAGLGFALSAVNPKNLAMCLAAGVTIGAGAASVGQDVVAVAVFSVIAAATVAVPVVGYAFAHERMRAPLDRLRAWLEANNTAVMGVLPVVIGTVLLGKGVGGLF